MTSQLALTGRGGHPLAGFLDLRRISKPLLSWVILAATSFVIALVLFIWLLLWLNRPRAGIDGWWVAQRGLGLPVVGHQADDLGKIVRSWVSGTAGPRDVGDRALGDSLRSRLAAAGSRPVVVYVSAVGVSDGRGGYLLRVEPGASAADGAAGTRQTLLGLEELVDLFGESPSKKKLLILDAGQVGSDRNLGVFANGFLQRLKSYLEARKPRGLAVLCSCAPGQVSWTSEADRCSIFGFYVAQGMAGRAASWDPTGRGLTVRGLHNYVRSHVRAWVAANRQSEQTPELLGDPEVNFPLPRVAPARGHSTTPATAAEKDKRAEGLWKRLDEGWARRDALQKSRPYRHTPLLWQQYMETLLRAERLLRVGDADDAEDALENLPALERGIAEAAGGLALDPPWSLALLGRSLADRPDAPEARAAELAAADARIEQALKELTSGSEESEPAPSETPAEKAPAEAAGDAEAKARKAAEPEKGPAAEKEAAAEKGSVAAPPEPHIPAPSRKGRGDSAFTPLIAKADDFRPQYVEAQLLVWAYTFTRRDLAAYSFKGTRGDLLADALRARRLAEKAAAADDRVVRWVVPLVEAGDALRRRAQDGLFAGDAGQFPALARLLEQARERYRQAVDVAEKASRALALVQRAEAELPYYGEWKARHGLRRDEGLDPALVELLKATAALARLVQAEPSADAAGAGQDDDAGDPLAAHVGQVRKWETKAREVGAGLDRLRDEFQGHCAGLAAAGGSGRWRDLDAALCVPLIGAEARRRLVQAVRSSPTAGTLGGSTSPAPASAPPPPDASRASNLRDYTRLKAEGAVASGRNAPREEVEQATSSAEAPSAPDPGFWRLASRLAQLEWGLLEIGGASETDLVRLSAVYESARGAPKGSAAAAFDAFAELSELIRALRAERSRAIRQGVGPSYAPLVAADRALRVVPLADALGLSDRPVEALDRYERSALLLWHGNRLLRDFAPEHASRVLENARQFLETEPLRAALEAAAASRRAKLAVKPDPADPIVIDDWSEKPLRVGLEAIGDVPAGEATVLVGFDPSQPLGVTSRASRSSAREGLLVPVRPGETSARAEYAVGRTESVRESLTLALAPVAFYRGRFFPADGDVSVTLGRANDPVTVAIQQSYEGLKFKDFTDQFKEHPGQGYLHFGTNLRYKLVLTSERTMKLAVRYGYEEHPESFKVRTVEVGPRKKAEIIDIVKGDDFPLVKGNDPLNIAPLNMLVTIWKDRENGEVQGRSRYVFRMIPPSRYISTFAEFDPATRNLIVWATHLANDPVTGPVEIFASIGGGDSKAVIKRSKIAQFSFQVPQSAKSVTWSVGIESIPAAFRETIATPPPQAAGGAAPPQ